MDKHEDTLNIETGEISTALSVNVNASPEEVLAAYISHMVKLVRTGDYVMFMLAEDMRLIEEQKLFLAAVNPETGKPFRSMREYFPVLVDILRAQANLQKLSERQLREYGRLDRLFVQNLGVPTQQIVEQGVSKYSAAAEAIDYDPHTGVPAANPRPGKMSAKDAMAVLEEAEDGGWRLEDVTRALDEKRGVKRAGLRFVFEAGRQQGTARLTKVLLLEDGVVLADTDEDMTVETAERVAKLANAMTNAADLHHYWLKYDEVIEAFGGED